jgi:hypothetical protein
MPTAAAAPPLQVRSLGWKIQVRCFSSRVAQPASIASAVQQVAKKCQRFMVMTE